MSPRARAQAASPKKPSSFYEAAWRLVRRVPTGRVVTYGQVATHLGSPRGARAVGYAMFYLAENQAGPKVPWHRVLNRLGAISIGGASFRPGLQKQLLKAEGVVFSADDTVCLTTYRHVFREMPERVAAATHLS